MPKFTKDTNIYDVLVQAPQSQELFMSIGMHCLGCILASGETIKDACQVHGVDADRFIEVLNDYVSDSVDA